MYRYQAAYRHVDGALVGYVGYGFAEYSAEENVKHQIAIDCTIRGGSCNVDDRSRYYRDGYDLESRMTTQEVASIKRQWKQIKDAKRKAGHSII